MTAVLNVYRGRTNVVPFDLGVDVTGDTIVAEIRATPEPTSDLLATWTVSVTDEATGVGTLTLDDSVADVAVDRGWTDILRVTGGEPVSMFDEPLRVVFVDMPTAVPA